jgi:6-phosphogluconate dehydrogenase
MGQARGEIGLIGLGAMGANLALNLAEKGRAVAVFNRGPEKTRRFLAQAPAGLDLTPTFSPGELVESLARPRALLLMVPAGAAVDAVLAELCLLLSPGDLVIDGGNSHFRDSQRRHDELASQGLAFIGLGVSGGEEGARHGPSLMAGGEAAAWARVAPWLGASAAQVEGQACAALLGPAPVGHYVKMVHNGIEYALMQLIAEAHHLMTRGLGLDCERQAAVFAAWANGPAGGFLVEISARVLAARDDLTGQPLLEVVSDRAGHKGTGVWTSQEALALGAPTTLIDQAVAARLLSRRADLRQALAPALGGPRAAVLPAEPWLPRLESALVLGLLLAYAQGFDLLRAAANSYGWELDLARVAAIWRGGCIIRARLLEPIRAAFAAKPDLEHLLLAPELAEQARSRRPDLAASAAAMAGLGLPAPGFMAGLAYLDSLRSAILPTRLIQAQRDLFGNHGFERVDRPGDHHAAWQRD